MSNIFGHQNDRKLILILIPLLISQLTHTHSNNIRTLKSQSRNNLLSLTNWIKFTWPHFPPSCWQYFTTFSVFSPSQPSLLSHPSYLTPPPIKKLSVVQIVLVKANTGVLTSIKFSVILANRSGTKTRSIEKCLIFVIKACPIIYPSFCYFTSAGIEWRRLKIFLPSVYLKLDLTQRFYEGNFLQPKI